MKGNEGWFQLNNAVKRHYFVDGRSLCERWMRFGDSGLDWDRGDNPNNCKACMKALKRRDQGVAAIPERMSRRRRDMTLEEAIELQETVLGFTEDDEPKGIIQATKLGIEALKREQRKRTTMAFHPGDLLPGETYIPQSVGKLPSDKGAEQS